MGQGADFRGAGARRPCPQPGPQKRRHGLREVLPVGRAQGGDPSFTPPTPGDACLASCSFRCKWQLPLPNPPGNPAWTRKRPRTGAGVHRCRPPGASLAPRSSWPPSLFAGCGWTLGLCHQAGGLRRSAVPQVEAARLQAAEVAAAEAACCSWSAGRECRLPAPSWRLHTPGSIHWPWLWCNSRVISSRNAPWSPYQVWRQMPEPSWLPNTSRDFLCEILSFL